MNYAMSELTLFLERMGLLHDSVVRRLVWEPGVSTLCFEIENLYSNFKDLPEYPGIMSGSIELQEVVQVEFDIKTDENRLVIFEFLADMVGKNECKVSVSFWPAGKISALCRSVCFPKNMP
ncbi:MAG: hypothetical protein LBG29_08930 [Synergistaceae bacterium]|jgi:hypothetical protein|nr:hypothetical protein [Synergistaceae bacterium]